MTHQRVLRSPWSLEHATTFTRCLLETPSLSVLSATSRHQELLALTAREVRGLSGSIVHDLHTAVIMREHGISRVVTADRDFSRFPFLESIDPFHSGAGPSTVADGARPEYGSRARARSPVNR